MLIKNETMERAFELAKKDGQEINENNAEGYFMASLAEEMNMINALLNTSKGQQTAKTISNNMANRMYVVA